MTETCHVCRTGALRLIPGFETLKRVTSDAKPFAAGGSIAGCKRCGTIQKPTTARWQAEADAIYAAYTIYHNAGGAEQNVFTCGGGQPESRSSRLIGEVCERVGLPERGRMLDLGCGNGAMLRSFSKRLPGWTLVGNELGDSNRATIEAIVRVEELSVGQPEDVPGSFDAVTMLHVLEHVPNPVAYLKRVAGKLNPGGLAIVEVPDHRHGAFDLVVADHCTHFTLATLRAAFEAAGLEVVAAADDIVPKELTVIGRPGGAVKPLDQSSALSESIRTVERQIGWLKDLARRGREAGPGVGVFGTSLGGAWLLGELGEAIAFFVDEDPAKIGMTWDGRPILHPRDVPAGATVIIGLPDSIAANVKRRLDETTRGANLLLPRAA